MRGFTTFLIASSLVVLAAGPTTAGEAPTVLAEGNAFTPEKLRLPGWGAVVWMNCDDVSHTSTSTQGFWDFNIPAVACGWAFRGGDPNQHTFYGAGTYPYACTLHPSMVGRVRLPVFASASAIVIGNSVTLQLSGPAEGTQTYDVQRRYGSGDWVTIKNDIKRKQLSLTPKKTGTYRFRARTSIGDSTSNWSPAATVTVSA
jgi:plastocyanin